MIGAHGSISANAAAVPSACLALWDAVKAGDHEIALELHKRLLRFWNTITGDNMPACVKYALNLQGCPSGPPRRPMPDATPEQRAAIKPALKHLLDYVSAEAAKSGGRRAAKK